VVELIENILHTVSQGPFPFLAYAVVAGIIFAESGLFFGFFLPGDSLLVTVGALAALPTSPFNIWILLPLLFIAAVLGDNVGYWFGAKTGPRIFSREDSRFFKRKYLLQAKDFYDRHGGKAIVLARFMPFVRTFAPIVAGSVHMDYKRFFGYNLLGGFLWAVGITLIGYFFGNIPFVKNNLEIAIVVIIILSVLPIFIHQIAERRKAKRERLAGVQAEARAEMPAK
jgi:membrane-associated protein